MESGHRVEYFSSELRSRDIFEEPWNQINLFELLVLGKNSFSPSTAGKPNSSTRTNTLPYTCAST